MYIFYIRFLVFYILMIYRTPLKITYGDVSFVNKDILYYYYYYFLSFHFISFHTFDLFVVYDS